jgi:hypothetical protein
LSKKWFEFRIKLEMKVKGGSALWLEQERGGAQRAASASLFAAVSEVDGFSLAVHVDRADD